MTCFVSKVGFWRTSYCSKWNVLLSTLVLLCFFQTNLAAITEDNCEERTSAVMLLSLDAGTRLKTFEATALSKCPLTSIKILDEVCVKYLRKFVAALPEEIKSKPIKIEEHFKEFCLDSKGKDNRFCYYIGGMQDSATYILGEMAKPISWSMPVEKVCEKLSKLDAQICDLKYDKQIDLKTVDLKKLKVRDLKKILDNWGETCDGCIEKPDFIKLIEQLKPKYIREEL